MKQIVFATNNAHKLEELRAIVGDCYNILSLSDIGVHEDIPEDAPTLEGNARAKALWVTRRYGVTCFADDTGLEVDALDGAPGVYSARYAAAPGTPGHDSRANTALLLKNLQGVPSPERTARFRTVIALVHPAARLVDGTWCCTEPRLFQGVVNGRILTAPDGDGGFGYDPVFRADGMDVSFARATPAQKTAVSHRGRATAALLKYLLEEEEDDSASSAKNSPA